MKRLLVNLNQWSAGNTHSKKLKLTKELNKLVEAYNTDLRWQINYSLECKKLP